MPLFHRQRQSQMVTAERKLTIIPRGGWGVLDGEATTWIFGISLGKAAAMFKD